MKIQRRPLLVEPPASAATDIAFILMIFFLVCASVQPGTGREQTIPRSEEDEERSPQNRNIEVSLAPGAVVVDGEPVPTHRLGRKLESLLAGKLADEDRIVIVKSSPRTQVPALGRCHRDHREGWWDHHSPARGDRDHLGRLTPVP